MPNLQRVDVINDIDQKSFTPELQQEGLAP